MVAADPGGSTGAMTLSNAGHSTNGTSETVGIVGAGIVGLVGALVGAGLPEHEAEDIVQEVLLTIHLKRGTWDQSRPIGPWLAAITRNKLVCPHATSMHCSGT